MGQQHPQRDPILLRHRLRLTIPINPLQNANTLELRTIPLYQISIIQRQPALLYQLHRRNAANHFSAGSDPENVIEGHGLFGVYALFPTGVRKECFSISVDDHSDTSRDFVRVGGDVVHAGPDSMLG